MERVKIIFLDGTEIEAEKNGSSYIVDEKPGFPNDLSEVSITGSEEGEKVLHNVQIGECASVDGRYWFWLGEIPEAELEATRTDAQVMYTALMTDTLLDGE